MRVDSTQYQQRKSSICRRFFIFAVIVFLCISSQMAAAAQDFIYHNDARLSLVKDKIERNESYFLDAYYELISAADEELDRAANPVVNKSQVPPSGDKHDYLSLAPYWWPDPNSPDGLPWIRKDGQVNPATRGDNTDQVRLSTFFSALEKLTFAYYFSEDTKYAHKAKDLIKIWFIDSGTKVNPNIKYGQGVPGSVDGRAAGVIEWTGIGSVITALQLLDRGNFLDAGYKGKMNDWFSDYLNWLTTSEIGVKEGNASNNHGNWYDFQVVGIQRYLGRDNDARSRLNAAKQNRIAVQIEPDGKQPSELDRTKSVYYSEMNLRAMSRVADMGKALGVDLWSFSTNDGRSIKKAVQFLRPYAEGSKTWTWEQITSGGVEKAIESRMKPMFSILETIHGEELINRSEDVHLKLNSIQRLQFPPLHMMDDMAPIVSFITPIGDQTVQVGYKLNVEVNATDANGTIDNVKLYIDNDFVRVERHYPYEWGHDRSPDPNELNRMGTGTHTVTAIATDNEGNTGQKSFTVTVP